MVETVFHMRYIIRMNAVKPPMDIPHSRTGINIISKVRMTPTPPMNIYGFLLPHLERVLSEIKPISGSVTASHSFATVIMVEATAMATPIVVIYLSIMHDISETPPPSIKPPMP